MPKLHSKTTGALCQPLRSFYLPAGADGVLCCSPKDCILHSERHTNEPSGPGFSLYLVSRWFLSLLVSSAIGHCGVKGLRTVSSASLSNPVANRAKVKGLSPSSFPDPWPVLNSSDVSTWVLLSKGKPEEMDGHLKTHCFSQKRSLSAGLLPGDQQFFSPFYFSRWVHIQQGKRSSLRIEVEPRPPHGGYLLHMSVFSRVFCSIAGLDS